VLVVFVLSHGDKNGVILTDHKRDNRELGNSSRSLEFETFTTTEVLTRIQNLRIFKESLKLIFFGVRICQELKKSL